MPFYKTMAGLGRSTFSVNAINVISDKYLFLFLDNYNMLQLCLVMKCKIIIKTNNNYKFEQT